MEESKNASVQQIEAARAVVFESAGESWLRSIEAAQKLDFYPRRSAWSYFKRLWRFGLLERRFSGKDTLKYRISNGGAARLRWLRARGT